MCIFPTGDYEFMSKSDYKALVGDYIYPDLTILTMYKEYEETFMLDLWHSIHGEVNPYSVKLKAFNVNKITFKGPILIYSTEYVTHERWEKMLTRFFQNYAKGLDSHKQ